MTTPTTGKYKLAETKRNYPIHLVIRIDPFCIDLVLFPVYQKKLYGNSKIFLPHRKF